MNNSIYKKKNAFKTSLPQYKDGGKKFAAGLAGFASGLPGVGQFIKMATANTDAVKDNPIAAKAGEFGATVIGEGAKMALNPMSAISGAPKIIGSGLDLGSTVAEEKGNTQRADRLDKAAMGFQAGSQAAGMASMMGGNFKSGEGISKMLGFGTMFGNTGGNIPIEMKNGGSIPKYSDGGYNYSTEGTKQGSDYRLNKPSIQGTTLTDKRDSEFPILYPDGTVTEVNPVTGKEKVIKKSEEKATGALEESISPLDLIGGVKGITALTKGALKYTKAIKPKYVGNINIGSHPKSIARAKREMNKGLINIVLPNTFEDGGSITNLPNNMASFRYKDGAIHKGNPTAELELKENGLDGDGEPFQVNAPSHEEGGVEVKLKEGAKILSDNKDLFGKKTPAKEAASLIKGLKQLQNREDSISENTKKRYEEKINEIFQAQEQFKKMKQAKSNPLKMKNGGKLPKYNDGAYFNPYGLGSGTVNTFGATPIESMNTMTPSVMLDNTTIPSIINKSNKNFINTDTETTASSLFPTKSKFAPATMNNPKLAGNKTNPDLLPINNPIIPTQSGMSQRRAIDFGADFDRNNPFKADKADTGSIFSQPGVAGGALKNVPSTLYNLGVGLFGKVQKTPPVRTQRTEKIGPVRFNPNEILMNRNTMANVIPQGSTSNTISRANLQALFSRTNTQLGELAQKEALANVGIQEQNQARALQENLTDQKAIQLAQQLNISAENAKKLALQEGIAGIGEIMDDTSKQKIAYGENQLGFGALQTMFSNWKLKNPGGTYSSFLKSIGKGGGAIEFVS